MLKTKNFLRNTTSRDKPLNLTFISIGNEKAVSLDYNDIINILFATQKAIKINNVLIIIIIVSFKISCFLVIYIEKFRNNIKTDLIYSGFYYYLFK